MSSATNRRLRVLTELWLAARRSEFCIIKNAVNIRFADYDLKKIMLFDQYPYGVAFIVDVEI